MNPLKRGEDFVLLESESSPDGMGGQIVTWSNGEKFRCLLNKDKSTEAILAEQNGAKSVFKGLVDIALQIEHGDVFKRLSDGSIFRVTSNPADGKTPPIATFRNKMFSAERFTLPE